MTKKKKISLLAFIFAIFILLSNTLSTTIVKADNNSEILYYRGEENFNWYTYNKGSTAFQNFALVTSDGKNETKQIAYCFNGDKSHPSNAKEGYTKSYVNATAEQFGKLVQNNKHPFNDNVTQMQKMIKNCIYFGYPYNKSDNDYYNQALQKTGGNELLASDMLRAATQYCVWDATDYKKVFSWSFNTAKAKSGLVPSIYEKDAVDLGAKIYTEAWKSISVPDSDALELDLYTPIGDTTPQNMLVLRLPNDETTHDKDTSLKETVDVSGTKTWKGDREENRPKSIDVALKQKVRDKIKDTGQVVTISNSDGWNYNFTNLPKYNDQGELIDYFVEERIIPAGYTPIYSHENDPLTYDICNKYQEIPISLTIEKRVTGEMGDLSSKYTFNLELKDKNGQSIDGTYQVIGGIIDGLKNIPSPDIKEITFINGKASIQLSHGQKITIKDLKNGYVCNVFEVEENKDGYITKYNGQKINGIELQLTGNNVITVENNKEFVPPTGINDNFNNIFTGLGIVSLMLIMLVVIVKICKRKVLKR